MIRLLRSTSAGHRSRAVRHAVAAALMCVCGTTAADAAQSRAYVVTTDFQSGGLSAIALANRAVTPDVAVLHSDARARWASGRLYVLNRFGQDNVQVIDPAQNYATVRQFSLGNGANPSDIVVVSPTKAYVSLYQRAHLAIVNPSTGASLGSIALGAFADADGVPEADRMARFGRWLFVAVQRLDQNGGFVPTDTSLVLVIDTVVDTVVDVNPALPGRQGIVLPRTNPVTSFAWDPVSRRFLIGCVGRYGVLDGGIVRIDLATFAADGVAITESALGGDVSDVEWHTGTHGYAILSDPSFNATLVSWNPATGTKTATLFSPGGFGIADMALNDRGELYVCDNSFALPGVRVFSATTDLQVAGPLGTGLPPYQVMFDGLTGDVLDVPVAAAAGVRFTTRLGESGPWRGGVPDRTRAGRRGCDRGVRHRRAAGADRAPERFARWCDRGALGPGRRRRTPGASRCLPRARARRIGRSREARHRARLTARGTGARRGFIDAGGSTTAG